MKDFPNSEYRAHLAARRRSIDEFARESLTRRTNEQTRQLCNWMARYDAARMGG